MYAQHTYHNLRTDVVGIELNLLFQNEMILNLIVFHATNTRQSILYEFLVNATLRSCICVSYTLITFGVSGRFEK